MLKNDKRPGGEQFKKMAVRLATYLYLLDIDEWDDLPPNFKCFFENLKYRDIVGPLVRADHKAFKSGDTRFKSCAQIAIKYRITEQSLLRIVNYKNQQDI